jgi:hypothetical protein
VLDAWERANGFITSAAGSLTALGVTEEQIRQLVEKTGRGSGAAPASGIFRQTLVF